MAPRKSTDSVNETGYPVLLQKLCREEDVLIIPIFVTQLTTRQLEMASPPKGRTQSEVPATQQRQRDSKLSEKSAITVDRVMTSATETKWEDALICGNIPPPQVAIVYENPDDRETPVAVICRNIYVEFAFMSAIGKSLRHYPMLSTLKIESCCISREIAEALALLLAEDSGKWITDLSLDGNEGIADVLPLFLKLSTGLKYFSLERCSLDDIDMELLAEALSYGDEKEQKLQWLNLSMNKIGDAGVGHLAEALRTNRTLNALILAGNQITDEGVALLMEVLQKFPLTYDEIVMRRKRVFDAIFRKKNAIQKALEELKSKAEVETPVKKQSERTVERMGRRIRGPDGKIRCILGRDLKNKPEKLNSGEKFPGRSRSGAEEGGERMEPSPSEILEVVRQVEAEILPDRHPYINEIRFTETEAWCPGCWSLANINLAYNYLTDTSVEAFVELLRYQAENFGARVGLSRVVMLPGNLLKQNVPECQKLQNTIIHRNTKRETLEDRSVLALPSSARVASSKLGKKSDQSDSGAFQKT